MTHPNASTAMARVIVDELVRNGVRFAVVAPGSRSSALAIACSDRPEIDIAVHFDERSAAFRALGYSAASSTPSVVLTTSGSAVANLMPAVVEAERSGIPLILATADRPEEVVRRRANQTLVQPGLFGRYVRLSVALAAPDSSIDGNLGWRTAVRSSIAHAVGIGLAPPGPVHLNIAFVEPTVPVTDDGRVAGKAYPFETGQAEPGPGQPHIDEPRDSDPEWAVDLGERPLVIAGRGAYDSAALLAVAGAKELPVLATALSQARGTTACTAYHHVLVSGVPEALRPTGVVVVGQIGPSERLLALTDLSVPVVHLDRWGWFSDPNGTMVEGLAVDPVGALAGLEVEDQEYGLAWDRYDSVVRAALDRALEAGSLSGPAIAATLNDIGWDALVVGSSLPIRDIDAFMNSTGPVLSNRGVSGIDGFVSTTLGVAGLHENVVGFAGDLSFLHDSNGLLTDTRPDGVFLVMDNNGGGLFDLLPQAVHAPNFERLFVTPHNRDLRRLADFHELAYQKVSDLADLRPSLEAALRAGGIQMVHAVVPRQTDLLSRREIDAEARLALSNLD